MNMVNRFNYALSVNLNDGVGDICYFCYKNILIKHKRPIFLIASTKPKREDKNDICPKCNLKYYRGQTEEAARYIIKTWLAVQLPDNLR